MCGSSFFNRRCLFNKIHGSGWLLAQPSQTCHTRSRRRITDVYLRRPYTSSLISRSRDLHLYNIPDRKQCLIFLRRASILGALRSTSKTWTEHDTPSTGLRVSQAFTKSASKRPEDRISTGSFSNTIACMHTWKGKRERLRPHTFASTQPTSRAQLESELLRLSHHGTSVRDELADIVIVDKVKPELQHYEALILENSSAQHGSASNVRNLLEECAEQDIPLGQTVFAAAFRTLAVHADPLLLADLLQACVTQWIGLDKDTQYLVAVSYLRSGQIELAQECMLRIYNEFGEINIWLHVLLIRQLVEHGDWEAILRTCYELHDDHMKQVNIPSNFWNWLLIKATEAEDVATIKWIWNLWVERAWIKPKEATILKVIQIAANHGLPKMAQSAATILKHSGADDGSGLNFVGEASDLVQKAYVVAGLPVPPTKIRNRRGGTTWWLFKDDSRGLGKLRIDPWTAIQPSSEAENVWPNIRYKLDRSEKAESETLKVYLVDVDAPEREASYITVVDPEELLRADNQELKWIDTQFPGSVDGGSAQPHLRDDRHLAIPSGFAPF